MVATVAAYLRRRGFRVFLEDRPPADAPDERRLALAEAVPDFLLLLTPATVEVMGGTGRGVHAEIARALGTARNVVLVAPSGAPAASGPGLSGRALIARAPRSRSPTIRTGWRSRCRSSSTACRATPPSPTAT